MCVCQVSSEVLRPHIPDLVKVLLQCFRDDSWLVRDGKNCFTSLMLINIILIVHIIQNTHTHTPHTHSCTMYAHFMFCTLLYNVHIII